MSYTLKLTTIVATTLMFAIAIVLVGAQTVAAQEAFDAPSDEDGRPASFKILKQKVRDAKKEVRGNFRERREGKEEFRGELREKRESFRERDVEVRREFRDEAKESRDTFKADAKASRVELKAELDAAETPEERQEILAEAKERREEMRKEALTKREEFRARAKDLRDDLKEQRRDFRVEIKTDAGKRIKGNLENVLNRVGNALETFTDILARVNNKIAELEANGADTTAVAQASLIAEDAIQDASATLEEARTLFERALTSDTPREFLEEMKSATRDAAEAVKDAHKVLKNTLSELKKLIRTNNDSDGDGDSISADNA